MEIKELANILFITKVPEMIEKAIKDYSKALCNTQIAMCAERCNASDRLEVLTTPLACEEPTTEPQTNEAEQTEPETNEDDKE